MGNTEYVNMLSARFNAASAIATRLREDGATPLEMAAPVSQYLVDHGAFGKYLDRQTRHVIRAVTGISLDPGMGSGTVRADGTISYRR